MALWPFDRCTATVAVEARSPAATVTALLGIDPPTPSVGPPQHYTPLPPNHLVLSLGSPSELLRQHTLLQSSPATVRLLWPPYTKAPPILMLLILTQVEGDVISYFRRLCLGGYSGDPASAYRTLIFGREDLDREREDVRLDREGRQPVDSCTFKQIIFDRLENAKSRAVNGDRSWERASLVLWLARES